MNGDIRTAVVDIWLGARHLGSVNVRVDDSTHFHVRPIDDKPLVLRGVAYTVHVSYKKNGVGWVQDTKGYTRVDRRDGKDVSDSARRDIWEAVNQAAHLWAETNATAKAMLKKSDIWNAAETVAKQRATVEALKETLAKAQAELEKFENEYQLLVNR